MSIVRGTGPLSPDAPGSSNVELDLPGRVLYLEPTPRRIRAELEGRTVLESVRAMLLHDSEGLPTYYVPRDDVRHGLLQDEAVEEGADDLLGPRRSWTLVVGDRRVEEAAWGWPEPGPSAPDGMAGLVAVAWDAVDSWFEEDEEVFVHPRDPYHRVDVRASHRRIRVRVGGRKVADTTRSRVLFETSIPPRYYIAMEDVESGVLTATGKRTGCPYKGRASYFSVVTGPRGEEVVENVAWSYPDPCPAVEAIRGMVAFHDERDEVELSVG